MPTQQQPPPSIDNRYVRGVAVCYVGGHYSQEAHQKTQQNCRHVRRYLLVVRLEGDPNRMERQN
jgi:hypothetical protein